MPRKKDRKTLCSNVSIFSSNSTEDCSKSSIKPEKATVRAEKLIEFGFNPGYFTHFWKNTKGDVYLFVYEYGFLKKERE